MQWIIDNKEWLFSGIGVFVLSGFVTLLIKKRNNRTLKMKLRSGNNSKNIQVGGDYNAK